MVVKGGGGWQRRYKKVKVCVGVFLCVCDVGVLECVCVSMCVRICVCVRVCA